MKEPLVPTHIVELRSLAPEFAFRQPPRPRQAVGIHELRPVAGAATAVAGSGEPVVEEKLLAEFDLGGRRRIVGRRRRFAREDAKRRIRRIKNTSKQPP